MKCPHCGMNIRDNIVECGYCGGKIPHSSLKSSVAGGRTIQKESPAKKGTQSTKPHDDELETEDEDEGGLSPYLQPGEQVQIGSLNVSVKKFFFHAYLTDRRIFLIDTQEKKLKVTAKDVARDTIAGCISEYSENSDPVLVLSIRSPDDEIKTMKLVFVQNGMDRSTEIDEWISLLQDERSHKKSSKKKAEEPIQQDEEPALAAPEEKPAQRQGLHPTKKPAKDHEKQPPVKRLLLSYKVPEKEKEPEPKEEEPPRRSPVRQQEPVKKPISIKGYDREIPPTENENIKPTKKPEVQSAMKVAMKSAMQPLKQSPSHPVRIVTAEPMRRQPVAEPEHPPFVEILPDEQPETHEKPARDEEAENPQFCHNCGKKLPHSANFCPGCGNKLSAHKAGHAAGEAHTSSKAPAHTQPAQQRKVPKITVSTADEDDEDVAPAPVKPPVKKAPPGSEMTILHKFLRR
ncbi:MAG: zinc-ribbon domain-containing protein [Methanoregula sp.]|nr:zinc-ribbon domain-containing protein [Methanoregula sp.]